MSKKKFKIFKLIKFLFIRYEKLKDIILNILFPRFCLRCQKEGNWICSDCLSLINISEYQYCPFCEIPKRVFTCPPVASAPGCGRREKGTCEKHRGKNLNGLFSATAYKDSLIKKAIKKFKYPPFLKELTPY
ncbi:hypothetical protein E3V08_05920, partial [Candidatus Atribacteria bacterium MT.SAG.1]